MKILKYLFLLTILALFGIVVFIATQKSSVNFQKSTFIKVARPVVFDYLNNYRNWELWASWKEDDATMKFIFPEKTSGVNSFFEWKGTDSQGKITSKKVVTNKRIAMKTDFDGNDFDANLILKDSVGGTKLTWTIVGEANFITKITSSFSGGINGLFKNIFERSLNNLNVTLTNEINKFTVQTTGIVKIPARYYLKTSVVCKPQEMQSIITATLPKIESFFKENNIKMNGKPFVIKEYETIDTLKLGIYGPAKETIVMSNNSTFTTGLMEEFSALKTVLIGDYSHIDAARTANIAEFNKRQLRPSATLQPMLVYFKTVAETNKPSKWITLVQTPIFSTPAIVKKTFKPKPIESTVNETVPQEVKPEKDEF